MIKAEALMAAPRMATEFSVAGPESLYVDPALADSLSGFADRYQLGLTAVESPHLIAKVGEGDLQYMAVAGLKPSLERISTPSDEIGNGISTETDVVEWAAPLTEQPAAATETRHYSLRDRLATSWLGRKMVKGAAGLTLVGGGLGMVGVTAASAEMSPNGTSTTTQEGPKITSLTSTFEFSIGASHQSAESLSRASVLGNYRTISKAKLAKAEKNGDCKTVDGSKQHVWTQGHSEAGHPYGEDTRRSRACEWGGKWYRELCGNRMVFKAVKNVVKGPIIWVNNFLKAKLSVRAHSEATAQAECKTEHASAFAYGHGEGKASASTSVRSAMKSKGRIKKLINKASGKANGRARSHAEADAVAVCIEEQSQSNTQEVVCPGGTNFNDKNHNGKVDQGECEIPKNGEQGPGAGTPGNNPDGGTIGGPGAGGDPGNTEQGQACYDSNSSTDGDQDPSTPSNPNEPATLYGHPDQNGDCVGPANPSVNA